MCSGAIIKARYPECQMIGINYGNEFPWKSIGVTETVFMVDFSLPMDDMDKLNKLCNLVWIDHHKTAIEEYGKRDGLAIPGMRQIGIGACALVWDWVHPLKRVPEAVQLLAEYDVWNHSNPKTLPFQYGMRIKETWPDFENMPLWSQLFSDELSEDMIPTICDAGRIVLRYEKQSNEMYMGMAFDLDFEGLKFIAVNRGYANSKTFDPVWDETKYDAMLAFVWGGKKWRCSVYTDKEGVDVSKIAVKYGGGGHAQASGFLCDKLPFDIKEK